MNHTLNFLAAFGACWLLSCVCAPAQDLAPPLARWLPSSAAALEPARTSEGSQLFRAAGGEIGARGAGRDSVYWKSPEVRLEPGGTYAFHFTARGEGSGSIISGPIDVNHDFRLPGESREFSYAFRVPDASGKQVLRLGQWKLDGEVAFARAGLYAVQVTHATFPGGLELGDGEALEPGRYTDTHLLGGPGTTIHRTLHRQRAGFNTFRWTFGPGAEVIYRHAVPFEMENARLVINVNYRTGGKLEIDASRDGKKWSHAAAASNVGEVAVKLPADVFPATSVYLRLRGAPGGTNLQVNAYRFEARVKYAGPPRIGNTRLLEERVRKTKLGFAWSPERGVRVLPDRTRNHSLDVTYEIDGRAARTFHAFVNKNDSPAGRLLKPLPPLAAGPHTLVVRADEQGRRVYLGRMDVTVGTLEESGYGRALSRGAAKDLSSLWWCEGARKVALDCPPPPRAEIPPGGVCPAVYVEAARGEYEPVQIVLRGGVAGTVLEGAKATGLGCGKHAISASAVSLLEVATVRVVHPTDSASRPGDYPDPLPPLKTPLAIPAGQNQAIWVLVHVPEDAAAGTYSGAVRLTTAGGIVDVPVALKVFDFSLPPDTHLRGGFGLSTSWIRRYHGLKSDAQMRKVFDLYMKSFAEHRIMPYWFAALDPMKLGWEGEGSSKRPVVDFSAFDRAAKRYLDGLRFNAFRMPLQGLGGGTFHARHVGEFGGFRAGTPGYEKLLGSYLRQIEGHLRKNGWLSKAYVYWFDEPSPKDYPFVVDVMKRLKRHAPGLKRMLTEQPEPALIGNVDIWCGLTPHWSPQGVRERRKAGEEVWWYLCTGPKAPYIGIFIEHPALEMRLWAWQSWQYGVEGLLVWETNYWTSPTAFPDSLQDPWKDPMSYRTGYGTPKGTKGFWGNGDGRFFYPPRRDPNVGGPPVIEPPISSLRWENLRDGVEDYEYFVLLEAAIRSARGKAEPALLKKARGLLEIPGTISRDLTHFTTNPRLVLDRRREVARMIETLQKL